MDGLSGPAHVEVWDWRKPELRVCREPQGHKGLVNALLFRPDTPWLIGAGGGGDNAFLAFWKTDPLLEGAADKKDAVPASTLRPRGICTAWR